MILEHALSWIPSPALLWSLAFLLTIGRKIDPELFEIFLSDRDAIVTVSTVLAVAGVVSAVG